MNETSLGMIGTTTIIHSKGCEGLMKRRGSHLGTKLGTRNGYNDISCKRVPRNDVRNGENYVNMDDKFHKRKDSSKDEGGKLAYKSIKTINFFSSNYYLSFEIYFKEIKLFSLVFMENGYQFYILNSLETLLEKKQFIEFNSISCAIPRVDEYHFNIANYASCVLGVEDKRSMEKELGTILEELPISLSLNLSLMCYEVSFVQ
ncbi:hypothetical protein M9H77_22537 [Catharanthus roseus]|uniref:Uncharacterized protein n=1 Tax=Catharanthus roseus TaxID=4058 RepID=A0ACC0ARP4_CATRO|nr:hypothetical protein M9H77_22537 [Catharanthus roseus]